MAEKRPTKREQFENAVYELGLTLIDNYRKGVYNNINNPEIMLGTVVEIFKIAKRDDERG